MRTLGAPASVNAPEEETEGLTRAGMTIAPGRSIMRTQTEHITAVKVQVPRDVEMVRKNCLFEAAQCGLDFIYSWEVKDRDGNVSIIEGMSIDGAMILLRNWGNSTVDIDIVEDTPTHWVFRATFIDYERGFTLPRLFRQRKSQKTGKMDIERALDIAFQIGQSKAQRNAAAKAIPAWLQAQCVAKAKQTAEGRFKDVASWIPKVKARAEQLKITPEQLCVKVGRPFSAWVAKDLVFLSTIFKAIDDRITTVAAEFGGASKAAEVDGEEEPIQSQAAAEAVPGASSEEVSDDGDEGSSEIVTPTPFDSAGPSVPAAVGVTVVVTEPAAKEALAVIAPPPPASAAPAATPASPAAASTPPAPAVPPPPPPPPATPPSAPADAYATPGVPPIAATPIPTKARKGGAST